MLLNKRIPVSYILGKIKLEFFAILIYSFAIGFLDSKLQAMALSVPLAIPTILGTAISLLIAFRTNQSYDRWWEARIIWGAVVNDSRTLIRQVHEFYKNNDSSSEFIKRFTLRQIAWVYALGESLRKQDTSKTLKRYLSPNEIEYTRGHSNVPNALLDLHASDVKKAYEEGHINEFQQIQIDSTIVELCNSMGKSERIKNTVFPRNYNLLLQIIIYTFATILPFSLIEYPLLIEVLLNVTITSIFFLIEKTAIYKQDPFENQPTDTPMTAIARTIEINLLQMLKEPQAPKPLEPKEDYYLL